MAKIKIKNLSRESNNRLRLIKTATSGGEGIGEQTGAVFETEQEIGICLSPDSVLTDVIVFPRNRAEMDAYLAAKPTPNVVDIFNLPGTVVTDKDILVDIADESDLDPDATIVTGFSYNKAQVDKAILDGNQESLFGTFQGYEGVVVEDPVVDSINIDLNALKQIAQFSTVINGRYVFVGSSRIQNSMRKVINEVELHDNNGPYLPTIVSLMVKAGYAPLTSISVGPQDNAEGVSVKLMLPVVTGNEYVNPYIAGFSTLIDEEHKVISTTGHAKLIANKENQLLYFTKLNKREVDAVLADTGISPDKILGEIQMIDRANSANSSVRYISKDGLQQFTKVVYGEDYIVAFYVPLDVFNHGECWLEINLSTTATVMKKRRVGGTYEFTMEADLKFAHWPEDVEEYNAWLAQINTTRDNSSSFLSPFALKRTVTEAGGVTEFKYDDISRLYIGVDVPEGFKVEAKRMDQFIAQAQDSDVIGHWKHDAGEEHIDAPFTVEMFKASVADGTIQLVHGFYIFFNTVAVPEETITADTESTFNLQVYDNTLPEKTLKKKRILNTSEVQIVDARFFPRDLGEQTAFVNAFGNPPIINLFNNPNITMTGMVESDAVITFRRITEADQGKLYPIGVSYGKEQFDAVIASSLPDDTLVTHNRVYSGPIVDDPVLNPSASTLSALRSDFANGQIKLVNGRYYHPFRPGVQHDNRLTIVKTDYDYDGSQPVFEPSAVAFSITERRLSNPVQARVGGVNEEEWLTVKGLFTGLGLPTANWINPFAEIPGLTSEIDENNLVISFIKPSPEYNEKLFPTIVALNKVQLDAWLATNPEPTSTALKMSYIDDQGQTNTQEIPTSDLMMIINTPGYTVVHDGDYYLNVGYTMSNAHARGTLEFIYGGLPEFIPAIINMDIEFEDARIALKGGMTLETDYEFNALRTATEGGLFADVVDSLLTPTVMGAVRTEDPDGTVWYDLEDIPRDELAKLLPYHVYVDKEQMDAIAATLQDTDLIAEIDWWENGNSYPSGSVTISVAQYKELVAENFGYDGKILIGGRTTIPQRDIENTKRVKSTIKIGQGGGYIPLTVEWNYRYSVALRTPLNTEIKPVDVDTWDSLVSLNSMQQIVGSYDINDFAHQSNDDWVRLIRSGEEGKDALMGLHLTGEYIGDIDSVDGWTILFEITETVNGHTNVDSITVAKLRERGIRIREGAETLAWIYPVLMGVSSENDTAKRIYRNHPTSKDFTIVERTANFTAQNVNVRFVAPTEERLALFNEWQVRRGRPVNTVPLDNYAATVTDKNVTWNNVSINLVGYSYPSIMAFPRALVESVGYDDPIVSINEAPPLTRKQFVETMIGGTDANHYYLFTEHTLGPEGTLTRNVKFTPAITPEQHYDYINTRKFENKARVDMGPFSDNLEKAIYRQNHSNDPHPESYSFDLIQWINASKLQRSTSDEVLSRLISYRIPLFLVSRIREQPSNNADFLEIPEFSGVNRLSSNDLDQMYADDYFAYFQLELDYKETFDTTISTHFGNVYPELQIVDVGRPLTVIQTAPPRTVSFLNVVNISADLHDKMALTMPEENIEPGYRRSAFVERNGYSWKLSINASETAPKTILALEYSPEDYTHLQDTDDAITADGLTYTYAEMKERTVVEGGKNYVGFPLPQPINEIRSFDVEAHLATPFTFQTKFTVDLEIHTMFPEEFNYRITMPTASEAYALLSTESSWDERRKYMSGHHRAITYYGTQQNNNMLIRESELKFRLPTANLKTLRPGWGIEVDKQWFINNLQSLANDTVVFVVSYRNDRNGEPLTHNVKKSDLKLMYALQRYATILPITFHLNAAGELAYDGFISVECLVSAEGSTNPILKTNVGFLHEDKPYYSAVIESLSGSEADNLRNAIGKLKPNQLLINDVVWVDTDTELEHYSEIQSALSLRKPLDVEPLSVVMLKISTEEHEKILTLDDNFVIFKDGDTVITKKDYLNRRSTNSNVSGWPILIYQQDDKVVYRTIEYNFGYDYPVQHELRIIRENMTIPTGYEDTRVTNHVSEAELYNGIRTMAPSIRVLFDAYAHNSDVAMSDSGQSRYDIYSKLPIDDKLNIIAKIRFDPYLTDFIRNGYLDDEDTIIHARRSDWSLGYRLTVAEFKAASKIIDGRYELSLPVVLNGERLLLEWNINLGSEVGIITFILEFELKEYVNEGEVSYDIINDDPLVNDWLINFVNVEGVYQLSQPQSRINTFVTTNEYKHEFTAAIDGDYDETLSVFVIRFKDVVDKITATDPDSRMLTMESAAGVNYDWMVSLKQLQDVGAFRGNDIYVPIIVRWDSVPVLIKTVKTKLFLDGDSQGQPDVSILTEVVRNYRIDIKNILGKIHAPTLELYNQAREELDLGVDIHQWDTLTSTIPNGYTTRVDYTTQDPQPSDEVTPTLMLGFVEIPKEVYDDFAAPVEVGYEDWIAAIFMVNSDYKTIQVPNKDAHKHILAGADGKYYFCYWFEVNSSLYGLYVKIRFSPGGMGRGKWNTYNNAGNDSTVYLEYITPPTP